MRISELSERSGVPVATVKYYLREGLLAPGEAVNVRESSYSDDHLARLRLIQGLTHVLGASVAQVREVLSAVDAPDQTPLEAMGRATAALPTARPISEPTLQESPQRAIHLLEQLGYLFQPDVPSVRELESALELAESVGVTIDDDQISVYGEAARAIAKADFARIPWDTPKEAITFAALGTVLYEPVLLALRRLAHHEIGLSLKPDNTSDCATSLGLGE